ncbi:hypothetical protein OKW45_007134 [Paraburkholderia sp. WSM4175]
MASQVMQRNGATGEGRRRSRLALEHDRSSANIDVFSGKSHLGGSSLQYLNENVTGRPHEAGSDAGANLLDRFDDFRVAEQQMHERRVDIVHDHAEMIYALLPLAARVAGLGARQRGDEKVDAADAQIHSPRTTHDLGVQAARKPCRSGFGVRRAQLQMIPLEFNHPISPYS